MNRRDSLNVVSLLQQGLQDQVQKVLLDEVVEKLVVDYEKVVREAVEPIVKRVSIARVESFKDLSSFREDLRVYLEWKNEDKETEADGSGE